MLSRLLKRLVNAKDVEVNVFDGPCPAGNVGVQVNHISPVNKGETVWTVEPTAVIFFGRLFNTGKVNLTRRVAVAGSMVKNTGYVDVLVGTPLQDILADNVKGGCHVRILMVSSYREPSLQMKQSLVHTLQR